MASKEPQSMSPEEPKETKTDDLIKQFLSDFEKNGWEGVGYDWRKFAEEIQYVPNHRRPGGQSSNRGSGRPRQAF